MSAANFIALLRELEFERSNQLRPTQFNAVFNDWNLRRFFEFFFAHVDKGKTFVSDEELKMMDQLHSEGLVVLDPEERRARLQEKEEERCSRNESNSSNVYADDEITLEWYKTRLAAERKRLEKLQQLEHRLGKLCRAKQEAERNRAEKQASIASKCKGDLKQTQIQLLGLDMRFRGASEGTTKVLDHSKRKLLGDQSILRLAFFNSAAASRVISAAADTLIKITAARSTLIADSESTIDSTLGTGDSLRGKTTAIDEELLRLRDALHAALMEKFTEDVRLADANARMEQMRRSKVDKSANRGLKTSTNREQDKVSVLSLQHRVRSYLDGQLVQDAATAADLFVVKVMAMWCKRNVDRASFCAAKEHQLLASLKNELAFLTLLESVIAAEKRHVEENGLQTIRRTQKLLRDRIACVNKCERRLEDIIVTKTSHSNLSCAVRRVHKDSSAAADSHNATDDSNRATTILELSRLQNQAVEMHKNVTAGAPVLDKVMRTYDDQLSAIERTLVTSMTFYNKKTAHP